MDFIMDPLFILQLSVVFVVVSVAEQNRLPETHGYWVYQFQPGEKIEWEAVKDIALRHEIQLLETF